MGPKYEFTDDTMKWGDSTLHRIIRLSDRKFGGWIESEDNLSQEGDCWVDYNVLVDGNARISGNAKVLDIAHVSGNAKVYDNACVCGFAKVYGNAEVYGNAYLDGDDTHVLGNAKVYGDAELYDHAWVAGSAEVYGNAVLSDDAQVFGNAKVYGSAEVCGKAKVCGNADISKGGISNGTHGDKIAEAFEAIKDFVYKIDDASKLKILTNYNSVDAFFDTDSDDSYIERECLTIITIDTKLPILKLEKSQVKDQNIFKFIVDITNEDGDDYHVHSIIDSKEKFNQLLQLTINSLKGYPQFNQYSDDLENYI